MWEALEWSILILVLYWTCVSASQCAPGWLGRGTSCYKKVAVPNGWLGAWHHCVSEGGNLVSITSSAEENFVKTTMAKYDRFWLGLSNQKCDKVWCRFEGGSQKLTWSDGQTTTHRNWAPNQLESANVTSCAYVNQNVAYNSGKWWSGSCASPFAYMCKRPLDCPTCPVKSGPAVVKTSDCDDGEVLYGDHCYFFGPTHETQEDGEEFCLARGAHLPRIHSKQDGPFLTGHIYPGNQPWLGLKKKGNDYKWRDGTALDYDDISSYHSGGECAYIRNELIYLNYECRYKASVICQTAKRGGGRPQLPPLVGQPDWTDKCGWWLDQPSSDFCYLIIPQPTKTWQEAQDHCKAHEGNLLSIADSHEQDIVHVLVKSQAQASSLWLGADVSLDDDDGKWIDGSSFTYKRQTDGEAKGANCLSLPTGSDNWKYDPCGNKRGYVCKKRGKGVKESLPSLDATKCPPGWLEHDSSCYKKEVKPNGWVGAWHHCVWLGGNLLSITSSAEEDFVKGTMDEDTPFWLGLSNQKCDDSWCRFEGGSQKLAWSDGQTTPHRNWAPNQLESADVASCAYVNQGGIGVPGKWRSGSCHSSLAYMCKRPQSCPEKQTCSPKHGPAVVTTAYCDDNAFHDDDYCYRYVKTHENYDDAEKFCQARGGHLASVHSKQEAQFVYDHSQTSQSALVGLKKTTDGDYEWSDGTTFGYKEWEKNTKGDCAFPNSVGELSGCQCSTARPFFCKTAKRRGTRRLPSSVSLVSWTDKCGWWLDNPTNDFCYQMISQPTKTWQKAQDHCKRLEGDLLSITDSYEQGFIESIAKIMMGDDASLWLGANGGIEGDGGMWTDGSPFSYRHLSAGDAKGGKCLSLLTGSSDWKRDKCDNMKGYICKKRGKGKPQLLLPDGYKEELFCQDDSRVLKCSDESVIRVQLAILGRGRSDVCLSGGNKSEDRCRMKGALSHFRALCDKHRRCPIQPTGTDPCPGVSKYHHIVYSCEEKVCLDSLGIAGGTIPDSSFSASSYEINGEPHKARLGGSGCWETSKIFGSWIQVNLGQRFKVTGIVTQRCMYQEYSYRKFELEFSTDGKTWYRHPEQPVVGTHMLTTYVFAQYVRLLPKFLGLRFDVLGCTPDDTSRDILCSDTATSLGLDGSMTVRCPSGCAQAYKVYGTHIYKQESNICAAAIHSGVIENAIGGIVTLLKRDPQKAYNSSAMNGITSSGVIVWSYGDALAQSPSYTFVEQEPRCLGPEWEEFADFCYKRFDERKTWYDAQQNCFRLNAKLVYIRSKVERDWLQDLLTTAPGDTWIGLNAPVAPGKFAWSDDQKVTLTDWAPEKLADRLETCVVASSQSGKWKMMSCVQPNGYMCKMPTERYALDKKGANASGE
ncbi:C-type mannose receptor 2 isoform X1 [Syngnathus scovelli]|uniref:C-type mannose receptor 2 isoform X1 n=2 Tax=Syngnathus scovelli TaxID=161590 RepID=UPI00210FEEB7|nr:C-type mannose receptor 2 isoform X1 [Syngnathus scovelli]XP_049616148.1 C-type mannose receptor 2 isoform X1 [Syngnathus scovelli]